MLLDHFVPFMLAVQSAEASGGISIRETDLETLMKMGVVIVIVVVVGLVSALNTAAREKTRREIAAYIAEGTMTTEQGERLIKARFKGSC